MDNLLTYLGQRNIRMIEKLSRLHDSLLSNVSILLLMYWLMTGP
jgi:hypothetical protein